MNEETQVHSFDSSPDRRGTGSVKWDLNSQTADGRDILPMWVADMDFSVPDVVQTALNERMRHPVFGYSLLLDTHREAFAGWQRRRNGWEIDPEWLVYAHGVMPAVRAAILAFTEPGDEVVVQPPVYYPFFDAVRDNGRTVVENPLVSNGSGYEMDLDHLAARISNRTSLLLLCSPHNPVGRVWSSDELAALAELCIRNEITIVCDEIHGDLIRDGFTFTSLASIAPEVSRQTVTCAAPTKTFNVAGIASAFAIAEDAAKRKLLADTIARLGMDLPNTLSLTASAAAYSHGDQWLDQLMAYLNETFRWLEDQVRTRFPQVSLTPIQGTYLAWLDFRAFLEATGVDSATLHKTIMETGGLWLSDGRQFGTGGDGFQRMNLACPRSFVEDGLDRIERSLEALG